MAESTLSLSFTTLKAEISYYLGFGRDSASWTAARLAEIEAVLKSGLRNFYFPQLSGGQTHEWSFLKPHDTVATVDGTYEYTLADNCGGVEGNFTFASANNAMQWCRVVPEGTIRQLRQRTTIETGRPRMVAVIPDSTFTGANGQRFKAIFHPIPDGIYTLTYRKTLLPNALTTDLPYPLGGAAHAETLLESCLAVAEKRNDDQKSGTHVAEFEKRLAASIAYDRRKFSPEHFGYNGNDEHRPDMVNQARCQRVSYNSVFY